MIVDNNDFLQYLVKKLKVELQDVTCCRECHNGYIIEFESGFFLEIIFEKYLYPKNNFSLHLYVEFKQYDNDYFYCSLYDEQLDYEHVYWNQYIDKETDETHFLKSHYEYTIYECAIDYSIFKYTNIDDLYTQFIWCFFDNLVKEYSTTSILKDLENYTGVCLGFDDYCITNPHKLRGKKLEQIINETC
jgi:hypothetical protein